MDDLEAETGHKINIGHLSDVLNIYIFDFGNFHNNQVKFMRGCFDLRQVLKDLGESSQLFRGGDYDTYYLGQVAGKVIRSVVDHQVDLGDSYLEHIRVDKAIDHQERLYFNTNISRCLKTKASLLVNKRLVDLREDSGEQSVGEVYEMYHDRMTTLREKEFVSYREEE